MATFRQAPLIGRRALLFLLGVFVAVGLVVVFTGTLSRSTDIEARAEQARAEIASLEERAAAGATELEFIESEAFIRQEARAYGFGEKDEIIFGLEEDAPDPEPIVPIGPQDDGAQAKAPFEAWMELLFGA